MRLASLVALGSAAAVAAVGSARLVGVSTEQQPTFRASTDVVVVEVQVIGAEGRPARGLRASDFLVSIDGRRRPVVTADLMVYGPTDGGSTRTVSAAGPAARNFWPSSNTVGRTFVLAIDAGSFSAGEGANVVRTVRSFIDQLGTNDAVGLVVLPRGGMLRPTTDRAAIAERLSRVAGIRSLRPNPFHLTPAEIIDINSEVDAMASQALTTVTARGRAQMATVQDVLRQVQTRECRGAADQVCLQAIVIDAESQARLLDDEVNESLAGFKSLLALLVDYPGRKTVVVLSAGMPASDRSGGWHRDGSEARALGRAAAEANATIYAVHVDAGYGPVFSAENRLVRPTVSLARERDLAQRLLGDFAAASGGTLFEAPTDTGGQALGRVLNETAAFYSLGIAAEPRDLDGRTHELKIAIDRGDVTVRSRRFVLLRRPGA